jgi:hypothetical protein
VSQRSRDQVVKMRQGERVLEGVPVSRPPRDWREGALLAGAWFDAQLPMRRRSR